MVFLEPRPVSQFGGYGSRGGDSLWRITGDRIEAELDGKDTGVMGNSYNQSKINPNTWREKMNKEI